MNNLLYFVYIAIAILVIRAIFFISGRSEDNVKKKLEEIDKNSPYRKREQQIRPHNDPLSRDKVFEKNKEEMANVSIYDPHNLIQQRKNEESQVVDVVKPVGFWTKFIMGQKLGFILARMGSSNDKSAGYWTKLIKAQDASQSKSQSRGR